MKLHSSTHTQTLPSAESPEFLCVTVFCPSVILDVLREAPAPQHATLIACSSVSIEGRGQIVLQFPNILGYFAAIT